MPHLSKFPRFPELFTNKTMLNQFCDKCSACKCTNECLQIQLRQGCNMGRHWCICINLGDQPGNPPDMHDIRSVELSRKGALAIETNDHAMPYMKMRHWRPLLGNLPKNATTKCSKHFHETTADKHCQVFLLSRNHFACLEPKGQHGYWRLCHFLDKNYTFAHSNFLLLFLCVPQSKEYDDPKPHQRWYVH